MMAAAAKLHIDYPRLADIRSHPASWWRDVLAIVHYAAEGEPAALPMADLPAARVMMPVLAGLDGAVEIWRLAGPMSSGEHGRVQYRRSERLLFAALSIAEQEFAAADGDSRVHGLRSATRAAYSELFGALTALGFPHPLRIWNVLPEINGQTPDGERYWHFNGARREAFIGVRRNIRGNVPAASALGSPQPGPLTVYCIAGARAQTRETVHNIRALLAAANARLGIERFALEQLSYKVYVRHSEQLAPIEQELRRAIGPAARTLYLKADICRRDLLVEIEAVGN